jgi:hypothetical protein
MLTHGVSKMKMVKEILGWIAVIVLSAFIGVLLAWRG